MSVRALEYIVNTVMGCFFVSALVIMLRPRFNVWVTLLLQFFFMMLSMNAEFIFQLRYWGYWRTPLLVFIVWGPCYFLYLDSKKRITQAVLLVIAVTFTSNILVEIYSSLFNHIEKNPFSADRVYILSVAAVLTACVAILSIVLWHKLDNHVRRQIFFLALSTPLGLLTLLHTIYSNNREFYYAHLTSFTLALLFLSAMLFLYSFLTVIQAISSNRNKEELDTIKEQQEQIATYYQEAKANMDKLHMIRHDLNNQLQVAEAMIQRNNTSDTAEHLVSQIREKLDFYRHKIFCNNKVIDTTLSLLLPFCDEKSIELTAQINVPEKLSIAELDLCSLFYNLAQNAIDACCELPNELRTVEINAGIMQGHLLVKARNPYTAKNRIRKDKARGYGLKIIDEICRKYNGSSSVKTDDGIFEITILLQCDAQEY